ncbi:MAG TPA: hypothetical protein ENI60_03155 [Candidatus Fraserbacteria bacterium]|nr:hypothetical protein [Candidatus Fraserbacteria bacterium]
MTRRIASIAIVLIALILPGVGALPATSTTEPEATIFFNAPCSDCVKYVNGVLIPLLKTAGISRIERKDFVNDRSNRTVLNRMSTDWGIPIPLQGHLATFIDDRIVLEGHVPPALARELLAQRDPPYRRILVYQDLMPGMGDKVTSYRIWAFRGPVKEYPIDTPASAYLAWFTANQKTFPAGQPAPQSRWGLAQFLPLVLSTGLLDGINPCAIAVLLFFIAFLFTLQRTRREMLAMGSVYIAAIYLTYFGIGLGLWGAIVISGTPHLAAKVGAWLLIALGLVSAKDYFWYGRGITLSVPAIGHKAMHRWLGRATLPATAVAGFLVGLCTFPCSGGIYVAVLGLLASKSTYWGGLGYLLLYNLMFVLPLIVLLLLVGNRRTVGQLSRWEAGHKRGVKLASGLSMVVLGGVILLWFV